MKYKVIYGIIATSKGNYREGLMSTEDRKNCKIGDPRIAEYTKRTRNGREQVFYTGNDERDFDRYRAEGGGRKPNVEMHDKPDTIRISHENKSYYAELIEGVWWWLDGCNECNGRPRGAFTYMGECDKHNVCRTCRIHRSKLIDTPWGGRDGWQCKPCAESEHEAEKQEALSKMPCEEDFCEWDYHGVDEITCPYCNLEFSDSWESADDDDEAHECPRCDNTFTVTAVPSLSFDCNRITS